MAVYKLAGWLPFLIGLVLIPTRGFAVEGESALSCRAVLTPHTVSELRASRSSYVHEQTVTITDSIQGSRGGQLFVVRANGQWYSQYMSEPLAPQGDPRWFARVVGREVGEFFGFNRIDAMNGTLPNPIEFQHALDAVNSQLEKMGRKPFQISYYPVTGDQKVDSRFYLEQWANKGSLPLANSGSLAIHDIAYHGSSFLLPDADVEISRRQTRYLLDFVDFASSRAKFLQSRNLLNSLMDAKAKDIDFGTGNVTPTMTILRHGTRDDRDRGSAIASGAISYLNRLGQSPSDALTAMVERVASDVRLSTVPLSEVLSLLEAFEQTSAESPRRPHERLNYEDTVDHVRHYFAAIRNRLKDLGLAVATMKVPKPKREAKP